MAFGQGARSGLSLIEEAAFGVTPSSPSMVSLPFNTHSLDLTKQRVQGNEIQPDRMPRVDRHGNRNAAGSISVDLRDVDYDVLLESAFFGAFDSLGVLDIGTTPKFMTIEDAAEDISQYRTFEGMGVSKAAFSIAPNKMVGVTFDMVGADMTQSSSPLDAAITPPSGGEPFDSYSGTVKEGGGEVSIITALDFSITNSLAPTFVVGSDTTPQLEFGMAVVEGVVKMYYEGATQINKFLNETETSIEVTVDDPAGGSAYTFLIPAVKFNGAAVPVGNPQSRIISIPFVGIYDSTTGTNLRLSKT